MISFLLLLLIVCRYKDANGNVTGNSPWRLIDYFHRTKQIDPSHYTIKAARSKL